MQNLIAPFDAYKGKEPYVFVSYAHKNSQAVFAQITRLRDAGFRIWYDEGIDPGTDWSDEIALALNNAASFLVFISPESVNSHNVKKEIVFALSKRKHMIAVYLSDTELPLGLEMQLGNIQAIMEHRFTDKTKFFERLQDALPPQTRVAEEDPHGDTGDGDTGGGGIGGDTGTGQPDGGIVTPDQTQSGNTNTNIANGGIVAQDETHLFYFYKGQLFKCTKDLGKGQKLIDFDGKDLNVAGDWVYFTGAGGGIASIIYRFRRDGSDMAAISDAAVWADQTHVEGDFLYCINMEGGKNHIVKMRTDGTMLSTLCEDYCDFMNVVGDYIYYQNLRDGSSLYRIKVDGSGREKLGSYVCRSLKVVGNDMYLDTPDASGTYTLARVNLGTLQMEKLSDAELGSHAVCGDGIFYQNYKDGRTLYKMNMDGRAQTKVYSLACGQLQAHGGSVYFERTQDGAICRINVDGSGFAELPT